MALLAFVENCGVVDAIEDFSFCDPLIELPELCADAFGKGLLAKASVRETKLMWLSC